MDYRELLKKYIAHVGYHEGIDYLRDIDHISESNLTPEEWAELRRLSEESEVEMYADGRRWNKPGE